MKLNVSSYPFFIAALVFVFALFSLADGSVVQAAVHGITPTATPPPPTETPIPPTETPVPIPTNTPVSSSQPSPTEPPTTSSVPPLPTVPPQEIPELGYGPSLAEIVTVLLIGLSLISLVVLSIVKGLKNKRS